MKLRNKKTGNIRYIDKMNIDGDYMRIEWDTGGILHGASYNSLAELNAEWEDYEEPKKYWGIGYSSCRIGGIEEFSYDNDKIDEFNKSIGNYFETREEAEKAVRKLKAWKRLRDKGFRFVKVIQGIAGGYIRYKINEESEEVAELLDLLFGGEE